MSAKIRINNFDGSNIIEKGILDIDTAVGITSLTLKNNQGFNATDYVLLGALGGEKSELKILQSINADQVTVVLTTATKEAHNRFDAFTSLFGNQIKIYRAANVDGTIPGDGSFTALGSPIAIDPDQLFTDYTDASGSSNYWYKFTYYNSTSLAETPISDVTAVRGAGYGNYCSVDDIRFEAGFKNNRWITDADIDFYRQSAQAEIDGSLTGTYAVPFTAPINPLIAEITRKLAAGFLLIKNYGPLATLNTNNGQTKIDEARKLLDKLNKKTMTLTDTVGNSLANTTDAGNFNAWPDPTTGTNLNDPSNGAPRMFTTQDRY